MEEKRAEAPGARRDPASPTPAGGGRRQGPDYRRVCPNCAAALYDRSCKSRCPRCGFFTDCSDPW